MERMKEENMNSQDQNKYKRAREALLRGADTAVKDKKMAKELMHEKNWRNAVKKKSKAKKDKPTTDKPPKSTKKEVGNPQTPLAITNAKARERGLSYGKYVALMENGGN